MAFQFPKGYLEGADAGQVEDMISQVLTVDTGSNNGQQQDQGGQGQQQGQDAQQGGQGGDNGGGQAAPPPTIQMGQTIDQVTGAIGPPEKIIDLGAKQIYVYKDIKVTFLNGKVSDVQ
ncbi:MAG: hypothetical protein WA002_10160 [Candidatus Acidiferrales bacterium]